MVKLRICTFRTSWCMLYGEQGICYNFAVMELLHICGIETIYKPYDQEKLFPELNTSMNTKGLFEIK